MKFTLPELNYAYDALSPHVDSKTMHEHHDFHHKAYVDNLNTFVEEAGRRDESLVEILAKTIHDSSICENTRHGLINNGGGHYNHSFFWHIMCEESCAKEMQGPPEPLSGMIASAFGSMDNFKKEFNSSAFKVFGSGWAWLVYDASSKKLEITTTPNQDTPFSHNREKLPVMCLDVWEHAYYLQYKHDRKKYTECWWNVVDWKSISCLFDKYAHKGKIVNVNADGTID